MGRLPTRSSRTCTGCERTLPLDAFVLPPGAKRRRRLCPDCTPSRSNTGSRKAVAEMCGACGLVRDPGDFSIRPSGRYSYPCKPCMRLRAACRKYSITPAQFHELRSRTVCDLCGEANRNKAGYAMHIDHNHETGEVRGVLCHFCNVMIGMSRENPAILAKAIEWVGGERG